MKLKFINFIILLQLPLITFAVSNNIRYKSKSYICYSDSITQGNYISKALSPYFIESNYGNEKRKWKCKNDISRYPKFSSSSLMERALYNMSLDEMINAIEPDSTFRTGKEWSGVWTRDVSYSIILAMAYMQPEVSMHSLMRKVSENRRIIQDTGTGGAWPCSTDRMIWTIAAWEVYKVTGSNDWLKKIYPIIKNTIEDDSHTIIDDKTGLIKGESSFIDWREQSYPKWMQPIDISQSKCLGTNVLYAKALEIASQMSKIFGDDQLHIKYKKESRNIKNGINKYLWMNEKGYFGQYLYGREYEIISPRSETLGEALAILFDISNSKKSKIISRKLPIIQYGAPVFYPFIKDIPPYHNNAIWPFVVSYWMLASAKAGNEDGVMQSLNSIYRAGALFCTNKENMVAESGSYYGTQINSSNMLWSLSGEISIVCRLIFGMSYELNGLTFHPFIPKMMCDNRHLKNIPYRSAIFDIDVSGYGNVIKSFKIDGKESKPVISPNFKNRHNIKIVMANSFNDKTEGVNVVESSFTLSSPLVTVSNDSLNWDKIKGAGVYYILKNGKSCYSTKNDYYLISTKNYGQFQVVASNNNRMEDSFASEPFNIHSNESRVIINKEINIDQNRCITKYINIPKSGNYSIAFLYSNGSGPIETDNKCAIRTLYIDNKEVGSILFPQRGKDNWMEKGWSNSLYMNLRKGCHQIEIRMMDWNNNMNQKINHAIIYELRLIKRRK